MADKICFCRLDIKNLFSVPTELLTNGTHFMIVALTAIRLIVSSHKVQGTGAGNKYTLFVSLESGQYNL